MEIVLKTLKIENHEPGALNVWENNARTHSKKQLKQIANSISEYGFTNPILIDNKLTILAGHGRLEAAKLLKLKTVPCVKLSHMTTAQKRAYVLADNKIASNAGWDEDLLAEELQALMDVDIDFDVELTGFTLAEVDMVIEGVSPEQTGNPFDDTLPVKGDMESRVQNGDIWQLGPHRLACGDALDLETVSNLMAGDVADMVFTDPPYNVKIDGNVCGKGSIKHKEFEMASGEMSRPAFTQFLQTSFENMTNHSRDGAIHFVCMDWRHMGEILKAGEVVYTELKNVIAWVKDNGGMGTFYRSRHELIFAFKHGKAPHINTFELGQHGRYRTNVWEYKGLNSYQSERQSKLAMHPTVKPVQMIADAIRDVSPRGGVVLDLFGGSGSTLIAAHKTGRRARLVEISPEYCDVVIRRWEKYAHDNAVLLTRATSSEIIQEELFK